MQPRPPGAFRQRFLVLSAAIHSASLVGLAWLAPSDSDVSPAPNPDPVGVSLVYVPETPTSSLETDAAWQRDGAEATLDTNATVELRSRLQARVADTAPSELSHDAKAGSCNRATRSPNSRPTEAGANRSSQLGLERSTLTAVRESDFDGENARTYLAGALVNVVVDTTDAATPHDQAPEDKRAERRVDAAQPWHCSPRGVATAAARDTTRCPVATIVMPDSTSPEDARALRGVHRQASVRKHGQGQQQQDREEAIRRIHEQVRKVMPLVYWQPSRKNERIGRAVVRFRLSQVGYVADYELVGSSGNLEIDEAAQTVLHLAEPYVYVPGWIELPLVFRG